MKDFNTYIIEKLKISKNTKIDKSFKKGDKMVCVSLHNINSSKLDLKIYAPFKVLSFTGDNITFKAIYKTKKSDIVTQDEVYLNSNGYYQVKIKELEAVFLHENEAIEFLNNTIHSKKKLKDLLISIFDEKNKDSIESLEIYQVYSYEELVEILDELESVKEERVDEKLKINKNTKLKERPEHPHEPFKNYGDFVMYIVDNAKFYGLEAKQDNYWITLKKEDSEYPQIKLGYLKDEKVFGTIRSNGASPDELGKELIVIVGNEKYEYDHLDTFDFAEGTGKSKVVDNDDLIPNPYNLDLIMAYLEKL